MYKNVIRRNGEAMREKKGDIRRREKGKILRGKRRRGELEDQIKDSNEKKT